MMKFLLCFLLLFQTVLSAQKQYPVGYQILRVQDAQHPQREIPVHVWYPARRPDKIGATWTTYVETAHTSPLSSDVLKRALEETVASYVDSAAVPAVIEKIRLQPVPIYPQSKPAQGRFPLVVLGSGLTSPGYAQAFLAEFLAANGFVAVGFPNRPKDAGTPLAFDDATIALQVADLEAVVEAVCAQSFVNRNQLYLAGWSLSGAVHILYQMKHQNANALVSLDAASQYAYGWNLIQQSPFFDPKPFKTPFFQLTAGGPARYVVPRSAAFGDSLATHVKRMTFDKTSHADMLSLAVVAKNFAGEKADLSEYGAVCDSVLLFLRTVNGQKPAHVPSAQYWRKKALQLVQASPFQNTLDGKQPGAILYQNKQVTAFNSISPQMPVHVLIVPNKRIPTMNDLRKKDAKVVAEMFRVARKLARELGIADTGYRLVINTNEDAGQSVFHLHLHLLGGHKTGPMVDQIWRNERKAAASGEKNK